MASKLFPNAPVNQAGRPRRTKFLRRTLPTRQFIKSAKKGRVVKIDWRLVFGTVVAVRAALALSLVSKAVNTSFVERHNGTDWNRNARKVRKSYCFFKDRQVHESVTYFTMYSYNFCWPVRTLRFGRAQHCRGSKGLQPWRQD